MSIIFSESKLNLGAPNKSSQNIESLQISLCNAINKSQRQCVRFFRWMIPWRDMIFLPTSAQYEERTNSDVKWNNRKKYQMIKMYSTLKILLFLRLSIRRYCYYFFLHYQNMSMNTSPSTSNHTHRSISFTGL